jgi:molecular chaperone DnaK (HSP70)
MTERNDRAGADAGASVRASAGGDPGADPGEVVLGIDLGTTNSEVAAYVDERVCVIGHGDKTMLPSFVGLSPSGELLVGETARNQFVLYPERTIKSIKRKMGTAEKVPLGDRALTPPEVSSLILRELVAWARRRVGPEARKAVITVPAYFSDAQRSATREAGELAGLSVVRILNEPTAASLAYGSGDAAGRTVMVYDLGGGTFDVSIVTTQDDVTEVLASHGNNHLGGDDLDRIVVDHLLAAFRARHGVEIAGEQRRALARLWWAAEEARRKLSFEPYVKVREEALVEVNGRPLDLELELSRDELEEMVRPLLETTLESVSKALADAGKRPQDLDAILLVGGTTRTPLVTRLLEERCGLTPRQEVDPDLCVAMGAGVLASRLAGRHVERVLVDISPYSFGPSYLGDRDGVAYPHCYHPIIQRNTPLPVTRTERYATAAPYQDEVQVDVYQGDDPDALKNVPVGSFRIQGLAPMEGPNQVLCRMALDLDGILHVTAIEKATGLSKHVTIEGALRRRSDTEISAARERLAALYATRGGAVAAGAEPEHDADPFDPGDGADEIDATGEPDSCAPGGGHELPADTPPQPGTHSPAADGGGDPAWTSAVQQAQVLLARSRNLLDRVHAEDREEAIDLHEKIEQSIEARDVALLGRATRELSELLFFVEGR